jgi:hypothetical protein
MPSATKNVRIKTKKTISRTDTIHEEVGLETDSISAKNKKLVEIYEPEPIVVNLEEKIEEDPLIPETEEEDGAEEATIDSEELNPFGDRWEE